MNARFDDTVKTEKLLQQLNETTDKLVEVSKSNAELSQRILELTESNMESSEKMNLLTGKILNLTLVLALIAIIQVVIAIIQFFLLFNDKKKNNRIIKILEHVAHKKVGSCYLQRRSFI